MVQPFCQQHRSGGWASLYVSGRRNCSGDLGGDGPFFHFSDTWQLIINTGTTIVTFLVVFLIQNTQNRDAKALHLKLDELIRSHHPASDDLIDIQKLSDEELDELELRYEKIRKACEARRAGKQPEAAAMHNAKNGAKHDIPAA